MIEIKSPLKYPKGTLESILKESYAYFNEKYPEFEEENLISFKECDTFFYENPDIGEMCSFVTLHDGDIVGMCSWDPRGKPTAIIGHNCIIPKHRGKKLGIEQMKFLVNYIREKGFTKIKVSTGIMPFFEPAQKMYMAVGFKEVFRDHPETSEKSLMHNMVYYEMILNMYKKTQNAMSIIEAQQENGLWGEFHSLAEPSNKPYLSEQALRRLEVLGYTKEDESIRRALDTMIGCLEGKVTILNRREKSHNWDLFTELMLSTWIRRFRDDVDIANEIAIKWANVVSDGFKKGSFNYGGYSIAYEKVFGEKIYGGIFKDISNFYHVSLLKGLLDPDIERKFLEYILNHEGGIYYLGYTKSLNELPSIFDSKQTVKFLASIDLLLEYENSKEILGNVYEWLNEHKTDDQTWVFSSKAKDKIYLPLSDSWREKDTRIRDCTAFVSRIVEKIKS